MDAPTLDRVPAEIWEEICQSACTDGGFTGRSLSCTSRSVNRLTKRMKLYSLAITRTDQLVRLAEKFRSQQDDQELQGIRHLFVVIPRVVAEDLGPDGGSKKDDFPNFPDPFDANEDEDEDEEVAEPEGEDTDGEEDFRSPEYRIWERGERVLKALRFILFNCPKLLTLFVHCSHRPPKPLSISSHLVPLPLLTRLSMITYQGLGLKTYSYDLGHDLPWFPSLRYFRISAGQHLPFNEELDTLMSNFVTMQAQRLTHARIWIRSLAQNNEEFQRLLDRFPKGVTTAIVEISASVFHTRLAREDEALFRAVGERFTFVSEDKDRSLSNPDKMRKHWEDEIQGLIGSWEVKEKLCVQLCPCHRCFRMREGL